MNVLGKKATFIPWALLDKTGGKTSDYGKPITGTVTYVNEEHSYFAVTYWIHGKTFLENFKFSQIGKDVAIRG